MESYRRRISEVYERGVDNMEDKQYKFNVPITDTLRIVKYSSNFTIQALEEVKAKQVEGEPTKPNYFKWQDKGYYGDNMKSAFMGVLNYDIGQMGADSIKTVISKLGEVSEAHRKILNNLK